jgi:adenylate kinase
VISKRIHEYNDKTAPVAGFYKNQGKFKALTAYRLGRRDFYPDCAIIETWLKG